MLPSAWPSMLLVFATREHTAGSYCWHNGVPQDLQIFFCRAACQSVDLQTPLCMGLFFPKARIYIFSSLMRSHWTAARSSVVSTTPHSFVTSANLLRGRSVPSSRSLMNKEPASSSINPWWPPAGLSATLHQPLDLSNSDSFQFPSLST